MGATLRYVKIVDADRYQRQGAQPRPGLEQRVELRDDPPVTAAPFVVLRGWVDVDDTGLQETWRIESRHGEQIYTGIPTTLEEGPEIELATEVPDATFEYADDYTLVLELDGREVARDDFPVVRSEPGGEPSP